MSKTAFDYEGFYNDLVVRYGESEAHSILQVLESVADFQDVMLRLRMKPVERVKAVMDQLEETNFA